MNNGHTERTALPGVEMNGLQVLALWDYCELRITLETKARSMSVVPSMCEWSSTHPKAPGKVYLQHDFLVASIDRNGCKSSLVAQRRKIHVYRESPANMFPLHVCSP